MKLIGKRGQWMGLAIFFVVAGALALLSVIEHRADVGTNQIEVLKAYTNLEGMRSYIENAARHSAYKALDELTPAGCFSNIDKAKFDEKLQANLLQYLGVRLELPDMTYTIELPKGYDLTTTISADNIHIDGIGDDLKIVSKATETLGRIVKRKDIKPNEEFVTVRSNADRNDPNTDVLKRADAPRYIVSGGANINIDVTCDNYEKYATALAYTPGEEEATE